MSRTRRLALYLLLVFAGGGLLAPWLWAAVQGVVAGGHADWAGGLARQPFHRYVHRCLLGLALVGLWPLARGLGCRRWADVGLGMAGRKGEAVRQGMAGLAVAMATFGGALVLEIGLGARHWRAVADPEHWLGVLGAAVLSGVVVGVLEEILFRGVLCGGLRHEIGWPWAILVSSVIYALVHLFHRPPSPDRVTWWSGWEMVGHMLAGVMVPEAWVPGGMTLVVAGVLLGGWYRAAGSLHGVIGLHAGWVVAAKMRAVLTERAAAGPGGAGGAGGGVWDSWVIFGVLLALLAAAGCREWVGRRGGGEAEANTLQVSGPGATE